MPMSSPTVLPITAVMPVLNCRQELPAHVRAAQSWMPVVEEIIVIDSFSTDGSLEYLKQHLDHPKVTFLSHPPGLYQSWNHAISKVASRFFVVSTIGDTINPASLRLMKETMEDLAADVVLSAPEMRNPDGTASGVRWPIHHFSQTLPAGHPTRIDCWTWLSWCLAHPPETLLGSSAGNLYRTSFMQPRPFPVDFGRGGDSAWAAARTFEGRFVFEPRARSSFLVHPPVPSARSQSPWIERYCQLLEDVIREAGRTVPGIPAPCSRLVADFARIRPHLISREKLSALRAEQRNKRSPLRKLLLLTTKARLRPSRMAVRRHAEASLAILTSGAEAD